MVIILLFFVHKYM